MDNQAISRFLKEADEFKKTSEYETMPLDKRDFFNEEIGRFSLLLELIEKENESVTK